MDLGLLATLAAAVAVGLIGALSWALLAGLAGRRRLERDLAATRADLQVLRDRVDGLARRAEAPPMTGEGGDYVITSLTEAPTPGPVLQRPDAGPPSRREFASVAVTESVVTLASFAHGVRRALSAENRNRIRFEMGREVKRARRQRRREVKEARRQPHAEPDLRHHGPGEHRADDAA